MRARIKSHSQRSWIRGFSLLELLAAVAMFAVMVVSLLGIFARGYLYARQMRMASKAYFYAQGLIEDYYNTSKVFLESGGFVTNSSGEFDNGNFTYDLNFTCPPTNTSLSAHTNLAEINATVYWRGRRGQQRSYSLVSYIANMSAATSE